MDILCEGIDWVSVGVHSLPGWLLELVSVDFVPCGGTFCEASRDSEIGVAIARLPRIASPGMMPYQIQFQGKFWSSDCSVGRFDSFGLSDYRVQRLDFRIDFLGSPPPCPGRGSLAEYSTDGISSGWKKHSSYYDLRVYDKSRESCGAINLHYGVREQVWRAEIQIKSKLLSDLKVGHDYFECVKVAQNRLYKIFDSLPVVRCVPLPHKVATLQGQLDYWQRQRTVCDSKISAIREKLEAYL